MSTLQQRIFDESKKLIKKFNLFRFVIYFLISVTIIILILLILGFLDLYSAIFVTVLALIYSIVRDFTIARYSLKTMDKFYEFLLTKKDNVELYIPVLEKNAQGYFLKKTAIYFENGEMYLEAFKQVTSKRENQESITVKYGRDFSITNNRLDKDGKVFIFNSFLMDTAYQFSIINIDEVINKINQRVKGE
ncbi:MAG: hypothetical protein PHF05_02950 [Candidatus Izemoplasmatales bacterium]|nr:hypothetical protein [Candidatus Izemoplasmatales bacterium]MDD4069388.1 hypothetical protein [Candidatus Izemoplasmatales bacterium]